MATPLEKILDNDLKLANQRLHADADRAAKAIDEHDRKVERMPWYERAFTYIERRHQRHDLAQRVDIAKTREALGHDITMIVHEAIKHHTMAMDRELAQRHERTVERGRAPHSRADDVEREL